MEPVWLQGCATHQGSSSVKVCHMVLGNALLDGTFSMTISYEFDCIRETEKGKNFTV